MPVIFTSGGFRFFFYSNEGNPREPVHVHVEKDGFEAKFWVHPDVQLAYNEGFSARILRALAWQVEVNKARIEQAWHDHFA